MEVMHDQGRSDPADPEHKVEEAQKGSAAASGKDQEEGKTT